MLHSLARVFLTGVALLGASILRGEGDRSFDEAPTPIRTVAPSYPSTMRAQGVSGIVAVAVAIDDQGNVTGTTVSKSTHPDFEKPALEAVGQWKFKPATKGGQPVSVRIVLPVKFSTST